MRDGHSLGNFMLETAWGSIPQALVRMADSPGPLLCTTSTQSLKGQSSGDERAKSSARGTLCSSSAECGFNRDKQRRLQNRKGHEPLQRTPAFCEHVPTMPPLGARVPCSGLCKRRTPGTRRPAVEMHMAQTVGTRGHGASFSFLVK